MNIELFNFYNWKDIFVVESNKIDPQPGYIGTIKGCRMYDNHMSALNFILSDGWELNQNTPLDIHRFLTKGIPFFEDHGNSGSYRNVNCFIGIEICPEPYKLNNLMNFWFKATKHFMNEFENDKMSAFDCAIISHHIFEVIHPFIDGNGRTGRLLINKILSDLGEDPIIIRYDDRQSYYDSIQSFRNQYWDGKNFSITL
jgi:Fic family protein